MGISNPVIYTSQKACQWLKSGRDFNCLMSTGGNVSEPSSIQHSIIICQQSICLLKKIVNNKWGIYFLEFMQVYS